MEKDIRELISIAREALCFAYDWAPDCDEDGDGYVVEAQNNLNDLQGKLNAIAAKYSK